MKPIRPIVKHTIVFVWLLAVATVANATTYYSFGNAAPNTTSKWWTNMNGTGSNPSNFTNAADIFIVQASSTYTTTAIWTVTGSIQVLGTLTTGATNSWTMTITGTTSVTGTLNLNNTSTKTFTGNVTVNSGGNIVINSNALTVQMGNLTVNAGGTLTQNNNYNNATAHLTITGDLIILGTYTYTNLPLIFMNGSGTRNINTGTTALCKLNLRTANYYCTGPVTINQEFQAMWDMVGGSFHTNGQTVISQWGLVNSGGTLYVDGGSLTVNGTVFMLLGRAAIYNGDMVVSSGTLTTNGLYLGTTTASPKSVVTQSGGTVNTGILDIGHTCSYTMSAGTLNVTGDVNLNYSSSILSTTTGSCTVNITGNLTNNGTISTASGSAPVSIKGNWINNGTFTTSSTNTVTFNGTSNQVIGGSAASTFYNLVINPSTGISVSLQNNAPIVNNLSVSAGIFDMTTYAANRTASGGVFTVSANAKLRMSGTSGGAGSNNNFPSNFSTMTFDPASTTEYYGTSQGIYGGVTYGHLSLMTAGTKTSAPADLIIKGNFTNSSTFAHNNGKVYINGTGAQSFAGVGYNILVLSNGNTKTTNGKSTILDSLKLDNSTTLTISNNDTITLLSSASKTARFAELGSSATINYGTNAKFRVERYIAAGRKWRFLSVPTNSSSLTFRQSWQENNNTLANAVPGYGIQVTSNSASWSADGFDAYSTSGPTIKYFDNTTNLWVGISNTTSQLVNSTRGYMVFVRGNRSNSPTNTSTSVTNLRTSGELYLGTQTAISVPAAAFASIGNPYASAIDMRNINTTNCTNEFYVWDPLLSGTYGLGAYQTFTKVGAEFRPSPGGGSYPVSPNPYNYIQAGVAFFVKSSGSAGAVTFEENDKTSSSDVVNFTPGVAQVLSCNLVSMPDNEILDGAMTIYDDGFKNTVDGNDGSKLANGGENVGWLRNGQLLAIERRHTIISADTLFVKLTGVKVQRYQWQLRLENMDAAGRAGFLIDQYDNSKTALNLNGITTFNFSVANIPGSYASDRFMVVFTQLQPKLPYKVNISANRNSDNTVLVNWTVENGEDINQYNVERSDDNNHFAAIGQQLPMRHIGSEGVYHYPDNQPLQGDNYYRIKSTSVNGEIFYSAIVKVQPEKILPAISIYPNPVMDGRMNILFNNQVEGNYRLQLSNKTGQVVFTENVQLSTTSTGKIIKLPASILAGQYQLSIQSEKGNKIGLTVVVQ
ncbi:MAG TPA: hypothetical protein VK498_04935 [Ferruginibacter sp.]|nr:hypothetical protein [Ferruginibacter sp.]